MKEIAEVEPNVTLVTLGERKFYLVGTAHVSRASAELVEQSIRRIQPDTVCLELCAARYQSLQNPERWRETDIFQVIKAGKAYVLMAQLALAAFQKRLATQFGIKPGEEMLTAMRVTDELKIPVSLVDREIKATLKRAWSQAGILGFAKMITSVINSFFSSEEISEAEIENLKSGDALASVMSEFSDMLPGVKNALIDERDQYMAGKIFHSPGQTVVAVLGAGHIPGILRILGDPVDTAVLETLPPKGMLSRVLGLLLPALLVGLILFGFFHSGVETSLRMLEVWAIVNGTGAALGALACLSHPVTVVVAFLSAPFAAIHPFIAVGWICALVEAFLRKPRVKDFETLADDITSIKGVWGNRVSKIFLILILTNLGSVIGTFIGVGLAARLVS